MKIMEIISMLEKCLNEGAHDVIHGGIKVEGNIGSGGKYMLQGRSRSEVVYPIEGHYYIKGITINEWKRVERSLERHNPDELNIVDLGEGVFVEEHFINIPNDFETRRGVLFCSPNFSNGDDEEDRFVYYENSKEVRSDWMVTAGYTLSRNGGTIFLDLLLYTSPNYSNSKPGIVRVEIEDKGDKFEVAKISRW